MPRITIAQELDAFEARRFEDLEVELPSGDVVVIEHIGNIRDLDRQGDYFAALEVLLQALPEERLKPEPANRAERRAQGRTGPAEDQDSSLAQIAKARREIELARELEPLVNAVLAITVEKETEDLLAELIAVTSVTDRMTWALQSWGHGTGEPEPEGVALGED